MPQINHGCVLTPTGSYRYQSLKTHTSPLRIDHRHVPHPHRPHYAIDHQDYVHIIITVRCLHCAVDNYYQYLYTQAPFAVPNQSLSQEW